MDESTAPLLSERQLQVHEAILHVGGYWRPISAVARVLEELGELCEQLERDGGVGSAELASELADVWIITTCLANQFNLNLDTWEPTEPTHFTLMAQLTMECARIARVVNYYDGPKVPRSFDEWVSLGPTISNVHRVLRDLADSHSVDLDRAIAEKLQSIRLQDRHRFRASFDPSTAPVLQRFRVVAENTACTFARAARLWGAPDWDQSKSVGRNVDNIVPYLVSYVKTAIPERLDSFVIELGPPLKTGTMRAVAGALRTFLKTLVNADPRPNRTFEGPIAVRGWQFQFYGLRLFVSVFSPIYGPAHARYSPRGTFLMLQPEESFGWHGIGAQFAHSSELKRMVREAFARKNVDYPADIIDDRVEARIYLPPRWPGDQDAEWWKGIESPQRKLFSAE